jgi:hypothetical protein
VVVVRIWSAAAHRSVVGTVVAPEHETARPAKQIRARIGDKELKLRPFARALHPLALCRVLLVAPPRTSTRLELRPSA